MRKILSPRQVFERSISEEDVFGACRQLLELNGARVHRITERIPWGPKGRKSEPGNPDIHGGKMNKLERIKIVYHTLRDSIPRHLWVNLAGLRLAKEIVEALDKK